MNVVYYLDWGCGGWSSDSIEFIGELWKLEELQIL